MFTSRFHLLSVACLVGIVGLTSCQQFANLVGDQDFDYEEPAPTPTKFINPKSPASRTRTSFSSPAQPAAPRAPPVQILKQINRHNEDGSYTYGFEGADGSFKIETKQANGEVRGKYGYVDDSGKVRVVEYGANRYGFQPAGEGITVAPPTLVDESKLQKKKKKVPANQFSNFAIPVTEEETPEYDDGQFNEEPQVQVQPQQIIVRPSQRRGPAQRARVPRPEIITPSANFEFGTDFQSQQFARGEAPRPSSSGGSPVPPRAQVVGAAPVPAQAPTRVAVPTSRSSQPLRPAPQFLFQQNEAPQPRQATRNFAPASSFDELEKQYALPSGGSNPTHDITFSAGF